MTNRLDIWRQLNGVKRPLHAIPLVQFSVADKECEKTGEDDAESEDLRKAFENWKSKTFFLTVPLRIVSLRGFVPPSWIKVCSMALNVNYPGVIQLFIYSDCANFLRKPNRFF